MYCKKCGMQFSANEGVCPNCKTLSSGVAANTTELLKEVHGKKNKGLISVIIILVVVLFLVGAAFGIYIYINSQDTSDDGSTYKKVSEQQVEDEISEPKDIKKAKEEEVNKTETGLVVENQQEEEFLKTAEEIEEYDENYLQTANTQVDINRESGIVFEKWDDLLNEVYQYLKESMPQDEFEQLRQDEIDWIKEKEAAIEAAGKEWEGGTGEPMARNMTGIDYTRERCYELIDMID